MVNLQQDSLSTLSELITQRIVQVVVVVVDHVLFDLINLIVDILYTTGQTANSVESLLTGCQNGIEQFCGNE